MKLTSLLPFFLLMFAIGVLTSCRSSAPLATSTEKETAIIEKTIVRDTLIPVAADSSSYAAVVSVDSTGQVKITEVTDAKGGKALHSPKVSIRDNVLSVDCYAEAQKILAQIKDKVVEIMITKTITKHITVPAEFGWFDQLQIYCGRLLMLLALFFGLGWYLKYKNLI